MARRKPSAKTDRSGAAPTTSASGLLDRLSSEEAVTVLRHLLDQHPELRSEAEQLADRLVSSSSIEEIAEDVHSRITSIDLDDLNGRAGAHSWGYVEPSQAAIDLLEEAVEDLVEDMKRRVSWGLCPRPKSSAPELWKDCIRHEILNRTALWVGRRTSPARRPITLWPSSSEPAVLRPARPCRKA